MEYRRIKDQDKGGDAVHDDVEGLRGKPHSGSPNNMVALGRSSKWKRKSIVTLALTVLTSSQAILIAWSKRAGKYEYSVTTANFLVEALKCMPSLAALTEIWRNEGVTDDNRLSTTWNEVHAGVLYRIILQKSSVRVLQTSLQGWLMAIGLRGTLMFRTYWLYVFGMAFNAVAILVQDFDAVMNKGFFHGSLITVVMILNHALSGITVSMVVKYADNMVKVYSTSVAMLLTAVVSVFLFGFHLPLPSFFGPQWFQSRYIYTPLGSSRDSKLHLFSLVRAVSVKALMNFPSAIDHNFYSIQLCCWVRHLNSPTCLFLIVENWTIMF